MEGELFGISEAARLSEVSEDTLRRYSRLGIVQPLRDRTTGRRLFTADDVAAARAHRERTRHRETVA
jgi:DNA-binding transcriptional MerR regulator